MKLEILFTLSFLFFVLTTNLPLAFSLVAEQVLDTNGNPISTARRYYILPAKSGSTNGGGGLRLGVTSNSTGPVPVVQDYSEVVNGLAVKFRTLGRELDILIDTQLDIKVEEENPECGELINFVDDFPKEWIGIDCAEDHLGKQIIPGRFHIQKYDEAYKLVFCPTIITVPPRACSAIGTHDDGDGRRLILTNDDPFQIVFVEADA